MKAMEKDRSRHYETANGLALDIQRHLRNEPVSAGPPGSVYRFGKMLRCNRPAFLAGGLALLAHGTFGRRARGVTNSQCEMIHRGYLRKFWRGCPDSWRPGKIPRLWTVDQEIHYELRFVWAVAVIEGDPVVVSSRSVTAHAHVRYAWAGNPDGANLFNSESFPAAPFRTNP